jgi:hypothetical protein
MRKIILSIAFLAIIMLGTTSVVHATTTKCWFYINLSDTCSPSGYHGFYDVELAITLNGSTIGTATCTSVKAGSGCYEFDFDIGETVTDPYYGFKLIGAVRANGACGIYPNVTIVYTGLYWSDLLNCSQSVTIVL